MAAIDLVNIQKRFGSYEAIKNLSLHVESGEFVVFLGPSGCGKTTLLRMIAGLEAVSGEEIHIGGKRVEHLPPGQRNVAMVFQNYALYPHLSVHENMAFGLRNVGVEGPEVEKKIEEASRILEIGHLLERKPTQLSGGQRQRVAIGRAIVKQPGVFLFDEPLSNLDAMLRAKTRVEIARLHQNLRATMIFVTHDQIEAMTMAEKIVVMSNGAIEQVGAPLDIYRRPATRFAASFVGVPAMNFIEAGVAEGQGNSTRLRFAGDTSIATSIPMRKWDGSLTLGIRPEAVRIDAASTLRAKVDVVERLGDRTIVHAQLPGGQQIVAEDSGDSPVRFGEVVGIAIDPDRTHLFDVSGRGYHAQNEARHG